jgi:hypothetical protein
MTVDIDVDTKFEADRKLESIEFVKFSAMLTEHYSDGIGFAGFLGGKTLNEIIDMTVGEVVTYIADCLAASIAVSVDADIASTCVQLHAQRQGLGHQQATPAEPVSIQGLGQHGELLLPADQPSRAGRRRCFPPRRLVQP